MDDGDGDRVEGGFLKREYAEAYVRWADTDGFNVEFTVSATLPQACESPSTSKINNDLSIPMLCSWTAKIIIHRATKSNIFQRIYNPKRNRLFYRLVR